MKQGSALYRKTHIISQIVAYSREEIKHITGSSHYNKDILVFTSDFLMDRAFIIPSKIVLKYYSVN